MPRQTGKGSRQRREAAFTRRATQHHQFIGEAEPERAEAEFRKHERVEAERTQEVVREMATELEQAAGLKEGAEPAFRIPRSIDEGKQLLSEGKQLLRDAPQKLREAPEMLREKAVERLEKLPEPAQKAMKLAQDAFTRISGPLYAGLSFARELVRIPMAMFRVLRQREV